MTKVDRLLAEISSQEKWIASCGGSLAGYIRRYGDPGIPPLNDDGSPKIISCPVDVALSVGLEPVPERTGEYYAPYFGSGGTAIWEADNNYLRQLTQQLERVRR